MKKKFNGEKQIKKTFLKNKKYIILIYFQVINNINHIPNHNF
jgi:hypothetical protein